MRATIAGLLNGSLVGWLAGEAGFPWGGSAMFAALSCVVMAIGVLS